MTTYALTVTKCIVKSLEHEQNGLDDTLADSIAIDNTADPATNATVAAFLYVAKHLLVGKAVLLLGLAEPF